ncbi:MAG: lytic transglycosylase domain-containing protein [Amaricoccus sp.]|uniref:lytic transglycosylase domain-containing protein n=1 Tax=Amaricoccus sp. TaxID=1872485 RepID=UPI0039E57828
MRWFVVLVLSACLGLAPTRGGTVPSDGAGLPAKPMARPVSTGGGATAGGAGPGDAAGVCRTIEAAARESALDAGFFARLLWKESLFQPGAISPAGAQGIAQFMPGTAKMRGLADAFEPEAALRASAAYLADLSRTYGNLGLAAAAYNGGEARVERFLAAKSDLPAETRAYVQAITGYSVEAWRDSPPDSVDLSLEGESFQPACVALAATRGKTQTRARPVLPWGVVIASNRDLAGAERQVSRLKNRFAEVLKAEPVAYTSGWRPGMSRMLHYAQVGRQTRDEAQALCGRLTEAGGDCLVMRN